MGVGVTPFHDAQWCSTRIGHHCKLPAVAIKIIRRITALGGQDFKHRAIWVG